MLEALFSRHKIILFVFVILVGFFAWHSKDFEINASADTLISEDNEEFIKSQKINQQFSPEEFLIIAYRPKSGDIFSETSLKNIAAISGKIEQLPRVKAVRSVMTVPLLSKAGKELSADSQTISPSKNYNCRPPTFAVSLKTIPFMTVC